MRCSLGLLVALACVIAVSGTSLEKARRKRQDEPVVIVDAGNGKNKNPFHPFYYEDPFSGTPTRTGPSFGDWGFGSTFSRRLNSMLTNLQTQFDALWRRFYDRVDDMRPGYDQGGLGPLPPVYHNTTSTRKVLNGSVITVNETIDKQADNNSMSFFHVKVIHVRPEDLPSLDLPVEIPSEDVPEHPVLSAHPELSPDEVERKNQKDEQNRELEDNMP